jgi:hypothetical protein
MSKTSFLFRYKLVFATFGLGLLFFVVGMGSAPKVGAWPTDTSSQNQIRCADGAGVMDRNTHGYAGLIVEVRWKVKGSSTLYDAPSSSVNITTYKQSSSGGNVVGMSGQGRFWAGKFNQIAACGKASAVVLGYGKTSARNGTPGPWALDCDESIHGNGNGQDFSVTGVGRPSEVPAQYDDGDWTVEVIRSNNGYTSEATIVYEARSDGDNRSFNIKPSSAIAYNNPRQKAPASPTSAAGYDVEDIAVEPGETVWFDHSAVNTKGNTSATFGRYRQMNYDAGKNLLPPGQWRDGSILQANGSTAGSWGNNGESFNVPNNAVDGARYCQQYVVNPSATRGGIRVSSEVCAVVADPIKWELAPQSLVSTDRVNWSVDPIPVEQGQILYFKRAIQYSGVEAAPFTFWITYDGNEYDRSPGTLSPSNPYYEKINQVKIGDNEAYGTNHCQSLSVNPPNSKTPGTLSSANACGVVVGGKTGISVAGDRGNIEPTEIKTFTIDLLTSQIQGYGSWTGYDASCSWRLARSDGSNISNGSCSRRIESTTTPTPTTPTYTATLADVGKQICLTATLTLTNDNFYTNKLAREIPSCFTVITRPYIQAFAGDVSAGCQGNNASVLSWNRNGGAGFAGAGGAYAVYAQNKILGFAAGQNIQSEAGYGPAPANLAFGNADTASIGSGNYANGIYGGGYIDNCTPDYYATKPARTAPWPGSIQDMPLSQAGVEANRNFSAPGGLTLSGGDIYAGTNARLYVDGDVYITGNINAITGLIDSMAHVPNFTLIAKGSIYVSPGVTSLYGGFLAGNQIVTCANGFAAVMLANPGNAYSTCGNPLTVTGSLAAKKIRFLRTKGSLLQNQAAEVVRYNPLASFLQATSSNTEDTATYDSITTLPPVL